MPLTKVDKELLQRCLTKKAGAWNEFVDRFLGLIYHTIHHTAHLRSVTLRPEDTEDIAAEVLLQIVAHDYGLLRQFKGQSSLATYLVVVARRICVHELTRRTAASEVPASKTQDVADHDIEQPPRAEVGLESLEEVQKLLARLPSKERRVVAMYYLEGRSYEEISIELNIPVNTIGPILSRARKKLRGGDEPPKKPAPAPQQPRHQERRLTVAVSLMYPLFLRMDNRLAVVIGGGTVGRRKAASLIEAGASVRVVCLEPRPTHEKSPALVWLAEPYQVRHLDGAALAIAAATPEVNRSVVADAHARGLLVCSSTEPDSGDFFTASTIRRGDLTLALGTGGAVPALTRALSDRLEKMLDDDLAQWLALLKLLRPLIQSKVPDPERRRLLWEELCGEQWIKRLQQDGLLAVQAALVRLVEDSAARL